MAFMSHSDTRYDAKGDWPESWACIDCGINTAPGVSTRERIEQAVNSAVIHIDHRESTKQTFDRNSEIYMVKPTIWKAAGMEDFGGCLCIGCLKKRIGRELTPKDFSRNHVFNTWPGTKRLLSRRGG